MTRYRFELAEPGDDAALRRVMAQTPMDGSVSLTFQREPSYFDANCVLGKEHQTIVCRDTERNEIVGLGSRSVRDMYVNGRVTRVGYLSGLRIAGNARNQGLLARLYRFLRELHDADPIAPDYYLTTIAEDNAVAVDQLTSRRAGLPTYHLLCRLHTLVLPIRRRSVSSKLASLANCHISQSGSIQEVVKFLNAKGAKKTFFPVYQSADFEQPDGTFRGLTTSSILVAKRDGHIIGTAGVWFQRAFRQTIVSGYKPTIRRLRPLLNLWSRVSGGIQLPAVGSCLEATFVCFPVVAENEPAVFLLLLQHLMQIAATEAQCLPIGLCDHDPLLPTARSFRHSEYTTRLYAVNWSEFPEPLVALSAGQYYLETGCL